MLYLFPSLDELITASPRLLIPLWQVLLFVVVITVIALFEKHRLVLFAALSFTVHWVFIENLKLLAVNKISIVTVMVFVFFGLLAVGLTLYQAFTAKY